MARLFWTTRGAIYDNFNGLMWTPSGAILLTGGGSSSITADLSTSIGDFTLAATAQVLIQGTLTASIGNFSVSTTGALTISGSGISQVPNFTLSAAGNLTITGSGVSQVPNFSLSSGAAVLITGAVNKSFPDFSLVATAVNGSAPELVAVLVTTFPNFTSQSAASFHPANVDARGTPVFPAEDAAPWWGVRLIGYKNRPFYSRGT